MLSNFAAALWRNLTQFGPIVVASVAVWYIIVVCLDPAGSYPQRPQGPGLTVDEFFNVSQGVYLVEQAKALGWLNLIPGVSQEAFRVQHGYNPDHPPLGRWLIGIHHELARMFDPPFEPAGPWVTACARTASATAFALTVLIVGLYATLSFGRAVGLLSAVSLVMMPRVFGHAHLASLETATNLTCTAAVLSVAYWWNRSVNPGWRTAILTGLLMGLALLTKIQAILIPIPVICWALWRWRLKAIVPLVIWAVTAFVVFFAGWPYLWFDSADHLLEYLGRTTQRSTIWVWYFGERFADKQVPWHYPLVMFGLTVPIALHGLGIIEVFRTVSRRREPPFPADLLLIAYLIFPLVLFALPGVAVYDGERLFLTCFPIWAIFAGRGWVSLWNWANDRLKSRLGATAIAGVLMLEAALPLSLMAPFHLCYYNEIVSLLGGADRVGLEIDYWGVGITRTLLEQSVAAVPEGATIAVTPAMHQAQAEEYRRQSPILRLRDVTMIGFDSTIKGQKYLLTYRRQADLPDLARKTKPDNTLAATVASGTILATFGTPEN